MLASERQPEAVFEGEKDCNAFEASIARLCSSSNDSNDMTDIKATVQNFTLFGLSENECKEALFNILPDASPKPTAEIIKLASTFLKPTNAESFLENSKQILKGNPAVAVQSLLDAGMASRNADEIVVLISATTDLGSLLCILIKCSSERRLIDAALKQAMSSLMLSSNKSQLCSFLENLNLLCTKSSTVMSALEAILASNDTSSEPDILLLLYVFSKPSETSFKIWRLTLSKTGSNLAKYVLKCGQQLQRISSGTAQKFKLFMLSYMQSEAYDEYFSFCVSILLATNRHLSRPEIIGDLLMIATESCDMKFIEYLNSILDVPSDAVTLSINEFKTVLDFVEFVPPAMILEFYTVLVRIALKFTNPSGEQVMNELCLIIRKQLASLNEHVCLNGVAGALALATAKVSKSNEVFDFENASCSQSAVRSKLDKTVEIRLAKEFLQLAYESSSRFVLSATFFFQNASAAVAKEALPTELMEDLNERLANDFQSRFVSDTDEDIPEDAEIKLNLMDDTELVVIRIFPVITCTSTSSQVAVLPLHLRLLALLEKKLNGGNLENIDAILKFPIVLPSASVDTQLLFISYLIGYNLFREMVNVFADQQDPAVKESCRKRLLHISELESELLEMMRKLGTISGLKLTQLGTLVYPDSVQIIQRTTTVSGSNALETVIKAASYCEDRLNERSDTSSSRVKLRTEADLFSISIPLERSVLEWTALGIDAEGKGKDGDALSEQEFLCLLYELNSKLQLAPARNLLPTIDGALESILSALPRLEEASDLKAQCPRVVLDLAQVLRKSDDLTKERIFKITQIVEHVAKQDGLTLNTLKLLVLIAIDEPQQQRVMKLIVKEVREGLDLSMLWDVLDNLRTLSVSLRPLFEAVSESHEISAKNTVLVKVLFEIIVIEISKSGSISEDEWLMSKLENISQSCKNTGSSECIELSLKFAKNAIESTVQSIIPRLQNELLNSKEEVLLVLKKFQQFTRTIQTFCNHIKSVKDKTLLKRVPPLKKCLEVSLLRIKQMLQANNCHGAFWVGNLKHKGLDGKEVESQIPLKRDEADESEPDSTISEDDPENEEMQTADEMFPNEDATLALSL